TDKQTKRQYKDFCLYENSGDIGSEYMYKQPNGEKTITTKVLTATTRIIEDTSLKAVVEITHEWELPKSATDLLDQEQQDRKSTRLNSSHVSISYAVFCLKKKK